MRTAHKPIYYNDPASAVVLKWDSDTHNVWDFFFFFFSDKNFILTWTKYILFKYLNSDLSFLFYTNFIFVEW